jgi:recombination protein RecA
MALPATLLTARGSEQAGSHDVPGREARPFSAEWSRSAGRRSAGLLKTAAELQSASEFQNAEHVLALGIPALDAVLPHGGLLQGSVIELQVQGASGAATSFALCACRAAQRAGEHWRSGSGAESPRPWCAFIDPSASLFAPGVARLGVDLSRLLVVRPDPEGVERAAIRIAEAKAVSLLVIDSRGALDLRERAVSSQRWQRTVRRLALAIKQVNTTILLLTSAEPRQTLPLPVAMRLEFARAAADSFELAVGKERSGRVSSARSIPWAAFEPAWH